MIKKLKDHIKGYLTLLKNREPHSKKQKISLSTKGLGEKSVVPAKGKEEKKTKTCMNCGFPVEESFCSKCGQKDMDYRRPYWTFIEDFSDNVISRDSRLWRTLIYILLLPGAMTRDFIAGKRVRFLPPIRFFLISIVIFFLTISVLNVAIVKFTATPVSAEEQKAKLEESLEAIERGLASLDLEEVGDRVDQRKLERRREDILEDLEKLEQQTAGASGSTEGDAAEDGVSPKAVITRTGDAELSPIGTIVEYDYDIEMFSEISEQDQQIPPEAIDSFIRLDGNQDDEPDDFWDKLGGKVERGLRNAAEDPRRLNNSLNNWVPIVMGIFVPMFALFLRFFYWKRGLYLYNHLVFSLHFHTYIFLVLIIFVLAQYFLGAAVSTWLFAGAVPLYLLVALKVATGQGWIRSFFKFLVISFFYVIGFSLTLSAMFILGLAEA